MAVKCDTQAAIDADFMNYCSFLQPATLRIMEGIEMRLKKTMVGGALK